MNEQSIYKKIRKIPFFFLLLVLSGMVISLSACLMSVGNTKVITVETYNLKQSTYHRVKLGENSFLTGAEGRLHWRVVSYKEAFLIALVKPVGGITVFDYCYFLLVAFVLFKTLNRVNEHSVFSDKFAGGFQVMIYLVIYYPFFMFIGDYVAGLCLKALTKGQFTAPANFSGMFKYTFAVILMIWLMPIINKAVSLQKEQELTV